MTTTADLTERAQFLRTRIDHHQQQCERLLARAEERAEHGWSKDHVKSDAYRASAHASLAQCLQIELGQIENLLHEPVMRYAGSR